MVPAGSHRISRVPRYSGYWSVSNRLRIRDCHPLWSNFPGLFRLWFDSLYQSYNPDFAKTKSVWALPFSIASTGGISIDFFSSGYLDVSVLRVCFPCGMTLLHNAGLPHSEIFGLKVICTSPKLIAAYHVLHRLWEPRHPPYALSNFSFTFIAILAYRYKCNLICFLFRNWFFIFLPICQRTFFARSAKLWRITDSNRWLPACKAGALASWANPPSCYGQLTMNNWQSIFNL